MRGGDAASGLRRQIEELPVSSIPVEQPPLLEFFSGVTCVHFGIYVAVGEDQILPSIVIDIQSGCSPSQIPGIDREATIDGRVDEIVAALVTIEGVGIVCEVGLEDIEPPVVTEVGMR